MPDISVIIVNWNSKDYLRKCLQSLARHHPPKLTVEIIVVDGGSFDGCAEMLAAEFPAVRFVQSPDNIGFARANNLGAKIATGAHMFLLNPDTELIEDSITILHSHLVQLPDAGAVGCRLLDGSRNLLSHSVQSFPTLLNRTIDSDFLRRKFPNSSLWNATALYGRNLSEVHGVSGACVMLKRECFERVQGFSPAYFMYGEDIDLCFRIWRAGFRIYHVPNTTVMHYVGGSSGKAASNFSTIMMLESCRLFMRTHRGVMQAHAYRIAMGISALSRLVLIPPLLPFGDRFVAHGADSLRKWWAVFSWSIGKINGRAPTTSTKG